MASIRRLSRRVALAAALLSLVLVASTVAQTTGGCVRITLLQVNDVYQFMPVDQGTRGGLARVLYLKKKIVQESPNTLFLMSGDTISPSVESIQLKGQQMIFAWNTIGLDYATLGNHEFDFGPDELLKRLGESKFKWIAANVIDKRSGTYFGRLDPFVIREFEGVRVGLFGILLPETITTSKPGENVSIRQPCETAREIVPKMRAAGAQVIVAVTHLAMKQDKELARCVPDIDLIIGGHEHTLLQSLAGHTPIFKMTADAREVGRFDLNIDARSGKLQSVDWKVIPVTQELDKEADFASQIGTRINWRPTTRLWAAPASLSTLAARPVGRARPTSEISSPTPFAQLRARTWRSSTQARSAPTRSIVPAH
jgi:5'-nucleotidase